MYHILNLTPDKHATGPKLAIFGATLYI